MSTDTMTAERVDHHEFLVYTDSYTEIVEMVDPDNILDCSCGARVRTRRRDFCEHMWAARRVWLQEQEDD